MCVSHLLAEFAERTRGAATSAAELGASWWTVWRSGAQRDERLDRVGQTEPWCLKHRCFWVLLYVGLCFFFFLPLTHSPRPVNAHVWLSGVFPLAENVHIAHICSCKQSEGPHVLWKFTSPPKRTKKQNFVEDFWANSLKTHTFCSISGARHVPHSPPKTVLQDVYI